jgi:LDH2 family malate/lactate/ureidoglycolate dehydrogenase
MDAAGNPITDPSRASEGFLVPIGGYKGAGLNVMIGLLAGVMTGAAFGRDVVPVNRDHSTPTNTGQAMIAFRPDLFCPLPEVAARMDAKLSELRTSRSAGRRPVTLPGEGAAAREAEIRRSGIPLPGGLVDTLTALATSLGVAVPF